MSDILVGKAVVGEKEFVFKFTDNFLFLYADSKLSREILQKNEIPFEKLDGVLLDGSSRVCFFFGKLNLGLKNVMNSFSCSWELKISVDKYILYVYGEPKDFTQISFYSKRFQKFLNMIPNISFNPFDDKEPSGKINLKFDSIEMKDAFEIDGKTYDFWPTYFLKWNGPNFDFIPGLSIKCFGFIEDRCLLKLCETMVHFIQYCFMWTNIFPEEISFITSNIRGNIYFCNVSSDEEAPEINDIYRDALPWRLIYKSSGKLFLSVFNNELHLLNLPKQKLFRAFVNFESIIKDAAAFECEFDNTHPNGLPHSDERKSIEGEIIAEITPLKDKSCQKKKEIYKGFIKHVRLESLCSKLKFALEEYSACFEKIKKRFAPDMSFQEISDVCSKARNDIAHGNKCDKPNQNVVCGYILIRCLIYSMQLRKAGLKDEDINVAINNLFLLPGLEYSK